MSIRDAERGDLEALAAGLARSPDQILEDLESFAQLLVKWQRVQNLVSRETLGDIWTRHIRDSLQIVSHLDFEHIASGETPFRILDIGSGGGLPALPLAIALKGLDVDIRLLESNGRKCAFLNAVIRELDLPARVHNSRIEGVDPAAIGAVDVCTARALAPLPQLFGYLHRFWGPRTRALLHKGRECGEELRQADSYWVTNVLKHPSSTDPNGVVLEVRQLQPKAGARQGAW